MEETMHASMETCNCKAGPGGGSEREAGTGQVLSHALLTEHDAEPVS